MRAPKTNFAFSNLARAFVMFLFAGAATAIAADAEIVSVIGKGDKRDTSQAEWTPALPKQMVKPGGFVRTRELSQMAVLLPDRTQLRLNQNSQMQIKTVADAAEWGQSSVRLNSGRAWSQARPPTAPAGAGVPPARITMETPSATLSIRGTDWEVEVTPDGRTQVVVLSGEVDVTNDQGSLKVGTGDTAAADIGKAPVRLLLANPAERVQWVTAWRVQPRRWVPNAPAELAAIIALLEARELAMAARQLELAPPSVGRDLLAADLAMTNGDLPRVIALLAPHANGGRGNAAASALLARAYLAGADDSAAAAVLNAARGAHPREIEIWLAMADLALRQGDAGAARGALTTSLELAPGNASAWFSLGRLETERENVRAGQAALEAALAANPALPGVLAERATLETFAGNLDGARDFFDRALGAAPDDYLALTGRGILSLKSGDSTAALGDFLRAGIIEPRFARAWLYSAAAFYQLGEARRAEEALRRAAQLDPNDPLPHLMLGLMAADRLDLGAAVDAAREAETRMPYLKSLNQVLNNQKGSANVGSALAAFGMDEWARQYATAAYSPWWAGSHLFLADRHVPGFNKNSELFKGFMTDPTVFGASQLNSSLVAVPGHHGRLDVFMEQANWRQNALVGTANGLTVTPFPLAYFVSGDLSNSRSRLVADAADGTNLTLGLGLRPHHAMNVFVFGKDTHIRGDLKNPTLPNDPLAIDDSRLDIGFNLRLDARNQLWLKAGGGHQSATVRGQVATPALVPLERFLLTIHQTDTQFRHAFAVNDELTISWGYEDSRQSKRANFDVLPLPAVRVAIAEQGELRSRDTYLSLRSSFGAAMESELGVFRQRAQSALTSEVRVNGGLFGTPASNPQRFTESNWRGGMLGRFGPRSTITAVAQKWRRPASVGSIAPIDTLGIAVNDRLTTNGGLYRRNRIQIDHEAGTTTFVQGFFDRESIRNLSSPLTAVVPDLQLSDLENLRNRRDMFTAQPELEEAPQFLEGRVGSHGFAINHRIGRDQTVALRYIHANALQTGLRDGLRVPYVPRDYLRLAAYRSLPERALVGVNATWRGERFRGEANTAAQRIDSGWIFGLAAYWESADKRWVLQGILENLRRTRSSSNDQASKLIFRGSYLF